jgi:hypothetical protein
MEIEEAIYKVREELKEFLKKKKDPVKEIEGLLKHVRNKTSMQLQNEASKYRAEMALRYLKNRK